MIEKMPVPSLKVREENKKIMFLIYEIISQGRLAGKLCLEVPNLDDKAFALLLVLFFQLDELVAIANFFVQHQDTAQKYVITHVANP